MFHMFLLIIYKYRIRYTVFPCVFFKPVMLQFVIQGLFLSFNLFRYIENRICFGYVPFKT